MPDPIGVFLAEQPLLILDGALATELEHRGADLADPLWSARCLIEQPALIRAVHADYFAAGADVATTATYQASFDGFERRGLDRPAATQLMRNAVSLALAARDDFWSVSANRVGRLPPLVAASIGPYGAMLADGSEYRGRYSVGDQVLRDFHRPRLQVLADSGADLFAFETIPTLREALILAELLREFPLTAWMSFSCRDGRHTSEGEDVAACAAALRPFQQVTAVGVNCTHPRFVGEILRRMASATDRPLLAYPNSGESYDATTKRWSGRAEASFADPMAEWVESGARLIGGCCRTTPQDIRSIRAAADRRHSAAQATVL
jgi:homocysteine S-methyltransferase